MARARSSGRNRIAVGAIALAVSFACAIAGSAAGASSKKPTKSLYTVHAILSLTGTASFLGTEERTALLALAKQVNATGGIQGHPLKFEIADNQSDPAVSVSLASALIGKVSVLIVGSVTTVDRPVDNLVTADGPVIYDLSPGDHPDRGSFVFSSSASTTSQTQAFVNFAAAKNWKRVGAITSTDASGQDGWNNIKNAIDASGGKVSVTDHETFAPTDVSVNSQLTKIQSSHPDAIFVWSTGTPAGTVFQGLQQLGMSGIPTMTTNGNAGYSQMHQLASVLPADLYFPGGAFQFDPSLFSGLKKKVLLSFNKAMTGAGSKVPDEGEALAWDPGLLVVSALRAVGVNAAPSAIRDWIAGQKRFAGIVGTYDFVDAYIAPDNRGVGVASVLVTRWDKKKDRWVGVSGPAGKSLIRHP
jgi:branched-chain amino acid transport system substrate-binding protein